MAGTEGGAIMLLFSAQDAGGFRPVESPVVSWLFVVLLACAVAVLVGAEWPRLAAKAGVDARRRRQRARRKSNLRLLPPSESEEFAASVERDLRSLPTIEERENRS